MTYGQVTKMERRYGREVGKYRAKINKTTQKAPFEKILARQIGICAVLLAVGITVSYADFGGKYVKETLYKSNTLKDWKETFLPVFTAAKTGTVKTASVISSSVEQLEGRLKLDKTDSTPVKAKADKQSKKSTDEKPSAEKVPQEDDGQITKDTDNTAEKPVVFRVPTEGEITSAFGSRVHPVSGNVLEHTGIDIAAPSGQTVISTAAGVVTATGYDDANGHYITVKHSDSVVSVYAHLSAICVAENETVDGNTKIGEVGSSGMSTGPHLHFEIKVNQESVNPESYITLPHRNGV